jgi:hypothetical protein
MCYVLLGNEHCEPDCANPRDRLPLDERLSISTCPGWHDPTQLTAATKADWK